VALKRNSERKSPFTGKVNEVYAQYRPDLTRGAPWILGHGHFLVIAVAKHRPSGAGTVFQAADGTSFVFSPARTRKQADRLAASTPGSTVLVVRPSLSFPAKEWVAADPPFWRSSAR
jgi:hypothetical protein